MKPLTIVAAGAVVVALSCGAAGAQNGREIRQDRKDVRDRRDDRRDLRQDRRELRRDVRPEGEGCGRGGGGGKGKDEGTGAEGSHRTRGSAGAWARWTGWRRVSGPPYCSGSRRTWRPTRSPRCSSVPRRPCASICTER